MKWVSIIENEEKRTFIFQVDLGFLRVIQMIQFQKQPLITRILEKLLKTQRKNKVLYECDRRCSACHDRLLCYYTTDITHAKNFEYENGTWAERHSYPEE